MSFATTTRTDSVVREFERTKTLRIFALALIVFGLLRLIPVLATPGFHNDFSHYYLGGWMYANGVNAYTEPLGVHCERLGFQADPAIPYAAHTPMILAMFGGLSSFTPETAYWIWLLCQFAIGLLFVETTRRIVGLDWTDYRWLIVVAIFCNSTCMHKLFYLSQVQMLVGSLLYVALAAQLRGKHAVACSLVAAATALKIFPIVLLPWFIFAGWQRFRSWEVFRRAATVVSVVGISVVATGIGTWFDFVTIGIPSLSDHAFKWANGSIQSFVYFLSETAIGDALASMFGNHAKFAAMSASLALVASAYAALYVWRPTARVAFCVLLMAATFGGVITWPHYMTMLLLPVALLWSSLAESNSLPRKVLGGVAGTLVLMPQLDSIFSPGGESIGHVLVVFYPLFAMLLVAWVLLNGSDFKEKETSVV